MLSTVMSTNSLRICIQFISKSVIFRFGEPTGFLETLETIYNNTTIGNGVNSRLHNIWVT